MCGSAYGHGRHPNSGGLCRQFLMSATSALALTVFAIAMTAEDARADDECGQPTSVTYCNGAAYNDITYQSGTNLVLNNAAMVVNGDINVGLGILGAKPATITTTSYQSLGGALNVKSSDTSASLQVTNGSIDGSSMISGPLTATTTGRGNASVMIQSGTISMTGAGNSVTALAQRYGDATITFSSGSVTSANETDAAMAAKAIGNGAHASVSMTGGSVTARQIALMAEATGVNATASASVSGGDITFTASGEVGIVSSAPQGSANASLSGVMIPNGLSVEGGVQMAVTMDDQANIALFDAGTTGIRIRPTADNTSTEIQLIDSSINLLADSTQGIIYDNSANHSGGNFRLLMDRSNIITPKGGNLATTINLHFFPGSNETFFLNLLEGELYSDDTESIVFENGSPGHTPENIKIEITLGPAMDISNFNAPSIFLSKIDSASASVKILTIGDWQGNMVLGGGDSLVSVENGHFFGTISGDYDQLHGAPSDIIHQGSDHFYWKNGVFGGKFYGHGGNDKVTISIPNPALNYINESLYDGGEDYDVFTFLDTKIDNFNGRNILNFEELNVTNSNVTFIDDQLILNSSDTIPGTVNITNGSITYQPPEIAENDQFQIKGDIAMENATLATYRSDVLQVDGNLTSKGGSVITMQDGLAISLIEVLGDYAVGDDMQLWIDVDFDEDFDGDPTNDQLLTQQGISGRTTIYINTVRPAPYPFPNGVPVIDVNGQHPDASNFVLSTGQYFHAGAWTYELDFERDVELVPANNMTDFSFHDFTIDPHATVDTWLAAGFMVQPYVPLYEAYQSVLLEMTRLPSLKTRSGGRYEGGAAITAGPALDAVWGRVGGGFDHFDPQSSTTGYDYDMSSFEMQAGLDGLLLDSTDGALIGGFTAHYQTGEAKVHSRYGDSKIHPDGYGFGGTLTWFGTNGFYTDAQAALTWYSSELKADDLPLSPDDSDAFGYALSLEAGQAFGIGDGVSLTPQAQLSFASISVDSFTGAYSDDVDFDDGQSLLGRVGLSIEKESAWTDINGQARAANIYGLANLYYEFLGKTTATVTDVLDFSSEPDDFTGEIGFGGSIDWKAGKLQYSAFAELTASTGFSTGSYGYGGNVGLKVRW